MKARTLALWAGAAVLASALVYAVFFYWPLTKPAEILAIDPLLPKPQEHGAASPKSQPNETTQTTTATTNPSEVVANTPVLQQSESSAIESMLANDRWAQASSSIKLAPLSVEGFQAARAVERLCRASHRLIFPEGPLPFGVPARPSAIKSTKWLATRLAVSCQGVRYVEELFEDPESERYFLLRQNEATLFAEMERFAERNVSDAELMESSMTRFIQASRTFAEFEQITQIIGRRQHRWSMGKELFSADEIRSNKLSSAQFLAISKLACDYTSLCGPEKFVSLRLCERYFVCRPGITVAEVYRLTNSAAVVEAADVIYERLRRIRGKR